MSRRKRRKEKQNDSQPKKNRTIIDTMNNTPNIRKTLTQFICLECYHISLVAEDMSKETPKYEEKTIPCSSCLKDTNQICVKDKEFTHRMLEMSRKRTSKEEHAYQIIKKSRRRGSK